MHGQAVSLPWTAEFCGAALVSALLLATVGGGSSSGLADVAAELRKLRWPLLLLLSVFAWLRTWNSPPSAAVAVHYVALFAACLAATLWLADWLANWQISERRRTLWIGAAVTVALVLLYGCRETYTQRWTGRNGANYEDTFRRWGDALIYRRVAELSDEGLGWSQGPMLDEKRHGRWRRVWTRPPSVTDQWYWQDERVSQEEWNRLGG